MGRGDKKTAKGKRFKGSFGNVRPSRVKVDTTPTAATAEKKAAKKAPVKKAAAKKAPAKKKED
jgi:30S ribosomal protein S31